MDRPAEILAMAKRRGFLYPSYEIYGGLAGFYDYGPLGAAVKNNIENIWRRMYVIEEGFAEISCPAVNPEEVFIASGHVKEFTDFVVECKTCGNAFRADHLIEEKGFKLESRTKDCTDRTIKQYGIRCTCGGELGEAHHANLMFGTKIGVGKTKNGYMRPETAQGMFLNFGNLYRYFREKIPFGAVQIGRGYRNEVSPRQALIRLREFTMAEAEVFFNPENKRHPGFSKVKDIRLTLVPAQKETIEISLGEAVDKGIIGNQALAYYIGLTHRFLVAVGVDNKRLRFRQHEKEEMAHYANECWDAEAYLDKFGWIELVGIADRSAYDLSAHMKASGEDLTAMKKYEEPRVVEMIKVKPDMKLLGQKYKKDAGKIKEALERIEACDIGAEGIEIEIEGKSIFIEKDLYEIVRTQEKVSGERFVPHVIEPSYGIDRAFYAVLDHNLSRTVEEGEEYSVLKLPEAVAPIKTGVFPLLCREGLDEIAKDIEAKLRSAGIECFYDDSGSIGRRYARMDEIGTPYCITVDFQTKQDNTVTVRHRDTKQQERIRIEELEVFLRKRISF